MISQKIIKRMGVTRGMITYPNGNGKTVGDGKTNVVEKGAIEDESAGGPVSVRGRQV